MPAQLLRNGLVYGPDGEFRRAAIHLDGARIVRVVEETDPAPEPTGNADVIDLGGAYVLPGFVDAHFHLTSLALKRERCDLGTAQSLDELLDAMRAWAKETASPYLVGVEWDESRWDSAVWASDDSPLEEVLSTISNGSFPAPSQRSHLTRGERKQLRDAMILEAHLRENRDIFVTDDRRAFINRELAQRLEARFATRIMTSVQFREHCRGLERAAV